MCNVFACYLDVESRATQDKTSNVWHKLLERESVTLLNDRNICTRVDPATGKGSLLDVEITSKNIFKSRDKLQGGH